MKLEDQLKDAQARLAKAQAEQEALRAEHAPAVAAAKAAEEAAFEIAVQARERRRAVTAARVAALGIGKMADGHGDVSGANFAPDFRQAVYAWSGLAAGEEEEAYSRDKNLVESACVALARRLLERDPKYAEANRAVSETAKTAHAAWSAWHAAAWSAWHAAGRPVAALNGAVYRAEQDVREIQTKISKRTAGKMIVKSKGIDAKDTARFIEARKRLASPTEKGMPAFVWPPEKKT